ncbi:MAG: NifB/NifX family molybdenum-iron cluster-binding protein [Bacillota bacterium]|uniref:ATPase n=1 Tax=Thermanaerosceptrum fracticalcis TaxID=1712410 RepID=A0A7G6E3A7_THEFR|nr:NifB/NifX family molybdenum-iron cluster-binding protein [Thermanaerosceptrum fracticalcis]QNB46561.1 ATPase [Thermanaerosceptrum fracticalcis]
MIIALPVAGNQLCMHFGHCESFAFFDVDEVQKKIKGKKMLTPPPHEPGILPPWIKQQGADVVITGGMGARAQSLFQAAGVQIITGAQPGNPEDIVMSYLNNSLQTGPNACDH